MDESVTLDALCESYLNNKLELERIKNNVELPEFIKKVQEKLVNKRKAQIDEKFKFYELNMNAQSPIVKYDKVIFQVYDGRLN